MSTWYYFTRKMGGDEYEFVGSDTNDIENHDHIAKLFSAPETLEVITFPEELLDGVTVVASVFLFEDYDFIVTRRENRIS